MLCPLGWNCLFLPSYHEGILRLVSELIREGIYKAVITLLIEVDNPPISIGMDYRKLVSRLDERFHEPHAGIAEEWIVAP